MDRRGFLKFLGIGAIAAPLLPGILAGIASAAPKIANARRAVFVGSKAQELIFGPFTVLPTGLHYEYLIYDDLELGDGQTHRS